MRLLVTGGAGFIGSDFIRYYLEAHPEDSILNLDVLTYAGNLENLCDVEDNPNYDFLKADICDRDIVFDAVKECDAIVHYAAESHVDKSILEPSEFIRTNVLGTQTLLDAAREYGKRFHHISTDEVFGTLEPDDAPFTENSPFRPRSPYSASKAASDHLVDAYHVTYGLETTITNCSNNYGPYHFPEKMIPLFISRLMKDQKVPLYGDGLQVRDWLHVRDHAIGVDAALQKGKAGETYLLGGKNQTTNLDLTKKLITLLGKDESLIEFVKDRPGHDRRYDVDCSKAEKELGWTPTIDLERGLQMTIDWFKEHQEWVERCMSGEYQEYYKKQYG